MDKGANKKGFSKDMTPKKGLQTGQESLNKALKKDRNP